MAISREIAYVKLDQLELDPNNPRIRRDKRREGLSQQALLEEMSTWTLDELIDSFRQAGHFWVQDSLIVVNNGTLGDGRDKYTVIEGNRRLAALKLLWIGSQEDPSHVPKWLRDRLEDFSPSAEHELFTSLPTLVAESRDDVTAYLGFRHVTGIKQWRPVEKAEFITELVEEDKLTYREVARKIGSRSDSVRQNYVAFKMLIQMEAQGEFDWEEVEERFSILFLSIRSSGTRDFLGVRLEGEAPETEKPIPEEKAKETREFAAWLFGADGEGPVVKESRDVDKFGEILSSEKAVDYLRSNSKPNFRTAYSLSSENDILFETIDEGIRNLKLAESELHGREIGEEIIDRTWPAIEAAIGIAKLTPPNVDRAVELALA